jgi:ABC-type polysaccharide/polyol phosphate export permease
MNEPTSVLGDLASGLRELMRARDLLATWTRREFRVRYSQSLLGATWALLQPLAVMLIMTVVFSVFLRVPTGGAPYVLFSYVGVLAWTFFANSIGFAVTSLVNNMSLVGRIYFPREILPVGSILVGLADFLVAGLLLAPMLLWYGVSVGSSLLWLPLVLVVQIVLMAALSLAASAVTVFFRDVRFLVPLALQVWMYATPVIYPVEQVPEWLMPVYFVNPMAALVDAYRRALLFDAAPRAWPFLWAAASSFALLIVSYAAFKRAERRFADVI